MAQPNIPPEYTVFLMGDGGVGKRSLLKSLVDNGIHGVPGEQKLVFYTNRPQLPTMTFNVRIPDNMRLTGGREILAGGGDAAILLFDVTSRYTYKNTPDWCRDVTRVLGDNTPIVLVGNKVEMEGRKVKREQIHFHRKHNNPSYVDMSVKAVLNTTEPFLHLARKLTGDDHLLFIDTPPEVVSLRLQVASHRAEVVSLRAAVVSLNDAIQNLRRAFG